MPRGLCLLFILAMLLPAGRGGTAVMGHCAPAKITPVPGDPGAYRIETAHGTTIARRAPVPASPSATAAMVVIRVFPFLFDADGDPLGTEHDTILVAPGTVVRWVRAGPGFHTITSGADSGDPNASTEFNYILDSLTTSVEHTFTTVGRHDYFCYIHEPAMEGTVIVTNATAGVLPPGPIRRVMFTRPPSPNPMRGTLGFAIALPRSGRLLVTVHDVAGRTVATIEDGARPAGEHAFQWNGRGRDGRELQSGRYFIRLTARDAVETRAVSLIR